MKKIKLERTCKKFYELCSYSKADGLEAFDEIIGIVPNAGWHFDIRNGTTPLDKGDDLSAIDTKEKTIRDMYAAISEARKFAKKLECAADMLEKELAKALREE